MTTPSITHRPIPLATASAAAGAVLALVGLTVVQHDVAGPTPSDTSSPTVVHHRWHPTTAGGRTQIGFP